MNDKEPEKLHDHTDLEEGVLSVNNLLLFVDSEVERLITKLEHETKRQAN